jgi:hypothetical protein
MGGGGKGGGSGAKIYDYYGTIAGAVCAGPVDELVAIIVDGRTVWPTASAWASGQSITTGNLRSYLGVVYKALSSHTASTVNRPPNTTFWTRYTLDRASTANPAPLTVEGYGAAYLYWGTPTQTLDTFGEAALNLNGHPPYRRQCVLVLKAFLFGRERTSAPNVEVIVRRKPNQSFITGDPASLTDGQSNPVSALADLYTDPVFGAGLTVDAQGGPDSTTWQATASALFSIAGQTAVSPILTAARTLRQFTADLLAYFDGWVRFSGSGEIEAGRFTHNAAPPTFTASTTIDYNDLVEEIAYTADGWAATYNQTQVRFNDRERSYKDGAVASVSGYNLAVTGEPRTARVDRPWITRRQQASDHAAEWQKINGEPKVAGTLVVRAEKAASIRPGDLFLLTHDALSVSIVCKCIGKDLAQPPAGRATIRFESDRASAPLPYQPTPVAPEGSAFPSNESLVYNQFFQPPPTMIELSTDATVVPLVARRTPDGDLTTGANVWLRKSDASGFYLLDTIQQFAITGVLNQNYNGFTTYDSASRSRTSNVATVTLSTTHQLKVGMVVEISDMIDASFNGLFTVASTPSSTSFTYANTGSNVGTTADTAGIIDCLFDDLNESFHFAPAAFTSPADRSKMLQTQTEDAINDNALLAIVFDDANRKTFEVMAVREMRLGVGESFYRLKVRRARYGTTKRAALGGDPVWIVYRSDLVALYHQQFLQYINDFSAATFRLQSINVESVADLADSAICPDITYTFADPYAPSITYDSVKAGATEITNFATEYATTDEFTVRATIIDSSADLIEVRLYAVLGSVQLPIWSQTFTPSSKQIVTTKWKFPNSGEWRVFMSAKDDSGRIRIKELTAGGGSSTVTIKIGVGSTVVAAPTISPFPGGYRESYKTITLSCSTAGSTIKYSVVSGGAAPGTYSTYTGPFQIFLPINGRTIYTYAEKTGLTTSATVSFDYWYEVPEYYPPGRQIP